MEVRGRSDVAGGRLRLVDWAVALAAGGLLAALAVAFFTLTIRNPEWGTFQGDLRQYLEWSVEVDAGERRLSSRPLLQALTIAVARLPGVDHAGAIVVVVTGAVVAAYVVTLAVLRRHAGDGWTVARLVLIAVALSVAAAVFVPWLNPRVYSRVGSPNVWHSPTQVLLVPLALAGFYAAEQWLAEGGRGHLLAASGLLAATALVKPNWALAFVPALGAYVVLRHRARVVGSVGLVAPTLAVLAAQYVMVFGGEPANGESAGVALGMLSDPPMRVVFAGLALAFPVAVLAVVPQAHRVGLALAWLVVAVAFAQRMFLVETGPRSSHGNWHWGYFAALKVAMTWSAVALVRGPATRRATVAWGVLALHAGSGVLYLWRLLSGQGFQG